MYFIAKIFRDTPIRTVFKTKNSIQSLLRTQSNKDNKFQKSGVYQLTCKNCGKKYTGQTDSSFEVRFTDHFHSFKNNNYNSKFAHLLEIGHAFAKMEDFMTILQRQTFRHDGKILHLS
jgi:hypothetical protein